MLIIDYSAVGLASILVLEGQSKKKIVIDEGLARHIILSNIMFIKKKFKYYNKDEGIIIACDDRHYWRKDIFPHYKANRKNKPQAHKIDWENVYRILELVKQELIEFFPYKVVQVPKCEADDIIAVLARDACSPTMIVSSDKDLVQLQVNPLVEQYSFGKKKMLISKNTFSDLHQFIMEGDTGDGIPNFLSSDDVFVEKARQKSMMKAKLALWRGMKAEKFCDTTMLRNYYRNKALIDLSQIPENYCNSIQEVYNNTKASDGRDIFNYFITRKLKDLMTDIGNF